MKRRSTHIYFSTFGDQSSVVRTTRNALCRIKIFSALNCPRLSYIIFIVTDAQLPIFVLSKTKDVFFSLLNVLREFSTLFGIILVFTLAKNNTRVSLLKSVLVLVLEFDIILNASARDLFRKPWNSWNKFAVSSKIGSLFSISLSWRPSFIFFLLLIATSGIVKIQTPVSSLFVLGAQNIIWRISYLQVLWSGKRVWRFSSRRIIFAVFPFIIKLQSLVLLLFCVWNIRIIIFRPLFLLIVILEIRQKIFCKFILCFCSFTAFCTGQSLIILLLSFQSFDINFAWYILAASKNCICSILKIRILIWLLLNFIVAFIIGKNIFIYSKFLNSKIIRL